MKYIIGAIIGWFAHLHYANEINAIIQMIVVELQNVG